jgi:hypothetical protein
MKKTGEILINGLTERHVAQIIRRKMIQKAVPCGKTYTRKEKHKKSYC